MHLGISENFIHYWIGDIYYSQSRFEEALAEYVLGYDQTYPYVAMFAVVYSKLGRKDISQRILSTMMERDCKQIGGSKIPIIRTFLALDEKEKALEYLTNAELSELVASLTTLANNPIYDPVRSDPRFIATMKRCGIDILR